MVKNYKTVKIIQQITAMLETGIIIYTMGEIINAIVEIYKCKLIQLLSIINGFTYNDSFNGYGKLKLKVSRNLLYHTVY